ncbi:uncharacterized protein AMSG_06425 [Thecamonas trahens ATCC 50062]|uniref:Uncharacterized protein n=1 Tax=Thecamonas trahens ATCC 50062 TaxID=461836 RepID=A0A0L0DDQ9_THETB|nr:hypothetical protein AMSG_06425 [Thecamonas trahens ATCC 50062]KNC50266.1 hypothetical protein AMSG_06425 [Thecamonas trahens ATCC 50062]|eukprot:XP_013757093.1 hypothetical protein AMSG_06425 [Thecamonas trahens ATCC 50062]
METVDPAELDLFCRECDMRFDSAAKLATHKRKFCVDSVYGDPQALQAKLRAGEKLGPGVFDFEAVKAHLARDGKRDPLIAKSAVGDVRATLRSSATDVDKMHAHLISQRQKEHVEELRKLKVEQARIRSERQSEETKLLNKLKELEELKVTELRDRMDRERARRELENIDRSRLTQIEREKEDELRRLERERAELDRREAAIQDEMEALQSRIASAADRHTANRAQMDEILQSPVRKSAKATGGELASPRDKLAAVRQERAEQRGAKSALAQSRHQKLLEEKQRLLARLAELEAADPEADGPPLDALVDDLAKRQANEAQRLRQLRATQARQLEKERAATLDLDQFEVEMADNTRGGLDAGISEDVYATELTSAHRQADDALKEILAAEKAKARSLEQQVHAKEEARLQAIREMEARERRTKEELERKHQRELERLREEPPPARWLLHPRPWLHSGSARLSPPAAAPSRLPDASPTSPQLAELLAEIESLKRSYTASGGARSDLLEIIEALEREARGMASAAATPAAATAPLPAAPVQLPPVMPAAPGSAAAFFGMPAPAPVYTPGLGPMYPGMMALADPMQDLLYRNEMENMRLAEEMEAFLNENDGGSSGWRDEFSSKMDRISRRLEAAAGGGSGGGGSRSSASVLELLREMEALEAGRAGSGDDELRALKREHLKDMMMLEFEKEKTRNVIELNKLRMEGEAALFPDSGMYAPDPTRVRMDMHAAAGGAGPADMGSAAYDPEDGFALYWDFVDGLPADAHLVHLAFALFDGPDARTPIKSVPAVESVLDPLAAEPGARIAVIDSKRRFHRVPILPDLRIMVEVQRVEDDGHPEAGIEPTVSSIGWAVVPVFMESPYDTHGHILNSGYLRVPLLAPPVHVGTSFGELASLPSVAHAALYIRLFAPEFIENQNALELDASNMRSNYTSMAWSVGPAMTAAEYARAQAEASGSPNWGAPLAHTSGSGIVVDSAMSSRPGAADQPPLPAGAQPTNAPGTASASRRQTSGAASRPASGAKPPRKYLPFGLRLVSATGLSLASGTLLAAEASISRLDELGSVSRAGPPSAATTASRKTASSQVWRLKPSETSGGSLAWGARHEFLPLRASESKLLVVRIIKRDSGVEQNVAWAYTPLFQYNANDELVVAEGSLTLALFEPPMVVPPEPGAELGPLGKLYLEVYNPESADAALMGEDVAGVARKAWMRPGDGFDVYIDGARYLPDNVTVTRAVGRVFTSSYDQPCPNLTAASHIELDASVYSPKYSAHAAFRAAVFDPTSTLLVKVTTVDRTNGNVATVGYAALNLFLVVDAATRFDQPLHSESEFVLNDGAFQLPLHMGGPNTDLALSGKSLASHKRVPCATILVRVTKAPRGSDGKLLSRAELPADEWEAAGLAVPAPAYESGAYDSTGAVPEGSETKLYKAKVESDATAATTIREILVPLGYMGSLSNDDEIQVWLAERLKPEPNAPEVLLDYAFLARYVPELGFRVAVDGALNLPKILTKRGSGWSAALFSLSPPASLYHPTTPLTSGAEFTTQRDFTSTIRCPRWSDGYKNFRNVEYNPYLVVVIEVFGVGLKKKKRGELVPCGWSILPVFTARDQYVQSGAYRIPMFQGRPSAGILERVFRQPAYDVLQDAMAAKEVVPVKGASLLVRVVDDQRDDEYREPRNHVFEPFLSAVGKPQKYVSQVKSKPLRTLVPKGSTPLEWESEANQVFADAMGLTHYRF